MFLWLNPNNQPFVHDLSPTFDHGTPLSTEPRNPGEVQASPGSERKRSEPAVRTHSETAKHCRGFRRKSYQTCEIIIYIYIY